MPEADSDHKTPAVFAGGDDHATDPTYRFRAGGARCGEPAIEAQPSRGTEILTGSAATVAEDEAEEPPSHPATIPASNERRPGPSNSSAPLAPR